MLQLTPSTEKSLVFSQFTSFLDKVFFKTLLLDMKLINYGRLLKISRQNGLLYITVRRKYLTPANKHPLCAI